MKYLVNRNNFSAAEQVKVADLDADVEFLDGSWAVGNELKGTGFVDELTLSYFDPDDYDSVQSIAEAQAEANKVQLSVVELLELLRSKLPVVEEEEEEDEDTEPEFALTNLGEEDGDEVKGLEL